jgi:hypothetical protein
MQIKLLNKAREAAQAITAANAKNYAGQEFRHSGDLLTTVKIIGTAKMFDGKEMLVLSNRRIIEPDVFNSRYVTPTSMEEFDFETIGKELMGLYAQEAKKLGYSPETQLEDFGAGLPDADVSFGKVLSNTIGLWSKSRTRPEYSVAISPRPKEIRVSFNHYPDLDKDPDADVDELFDEIYTRTALKGMSPQKAAQFIHKECPLSKYI